MDIKKTTCLATLVALLGAGGMLVLAANEKDQVTLKPRRTTRLYVRTLPPGAEIKLDGEHRGFSDRLFRVPPGVRKMTVEVELDGHYPKQQEVEIRGGWITRVELELEERPKDTAAGSPTRPAEVKVPVGAVTLSHVADSSEDKRSLGGSGHAVKFERPADVKHVLAVRIYASRYGHPRPPDEDFHVYLLDQDRKVIKDLTYPYSMIQRTSKMRWYTLAVPGVEVPEKFHVALSFSPHQTKGIYLGIDKNAEETHSYIGLPDRGYKKVTDGYDWMVRAIVSSDQDAMKNAVGVTPTTIAEPEKRQEEERGQPEERGQRPLSSRGGIDTLPPVVVETVPQSGDTNVDPSISEIRVTFSKEMTDGSWSWSQSSDETFPQVTEEPRYLADKRTCVLPVKLQAAKTYVSWLNSAKFGNFKDAQGRSAVPYLLIFETRK